MKLLLYCTKAKPYLVQGVAKPMHTLDANNPFNFIWKLVNKGFSNDRLNGKIFAECDFEVEEISSEKLDTGVGYEPIFYTETIDDISKKSCLTQFEIENYLGCKAGGEVVGYAIHIKNLHIFDETRELNDYDQYEYERFSSNYGCIGTEWKPLEKAPQNMMYCYDEGEKRILISIKPEWLCKILNGEKTIEVRKKVLKEMLDNV